MRVLIVAEKLYVYYGDFPALKDINLSIEPGKLNILLGPNGSGKTTFLKTILGILKPRHGKISVYGFTPWRDHVKIKKITGYVPEDDILYHSLTVKEYLYMIARIRGIPRDMVDEAVERMLDAFQLRGKSDEFIGSLSHGYKRRVLLAEAFIHNPQIYLLDEPFIGIDPRLARALKNVLREKVREGKLIIVTTHILEIAEAIADNIILLYNGEVKAVGKLEEILEEAKAGGLEEAFLELTMSYQSVREIIRALMG